MPSRYQHIYPTTPIVESDELKSRTAADLLTLEYFETEGGEMPYMEFVQHHVLLNVGPPYSVHHKRGDEQLEFIHHPNEIIITPSGIKNGWRWEEPTKVIVITLDPDKLARFAQAELGVTLADSQLQSRMKFLDADLTNAGLLLKDALESIFGSTVMFESYARIFLTKLLEKYGVEGGGHYQFTQNFTANHFRKVLEYIKANMANPISIEDLSKEIAISKYHFAKLFKQVIGLSPYKFVMAYRVEQAKIMLANKQRPLSEIAHLCGFSDQAHFSRVFKQQTKLSPAAWRKSL